MFDMNLQSAAIDIGALDADRVTTVEEFKSWIRHRVRPIFPLKGASGFGSTSCAATGVTIRETSVR